MKHYGNILLIAILTIVLALSIAQAQENGKIYHLSYSPAEPVVLEDLKISIGVENPGDKAQNYFLQVQVTEEGKLIGKHEFTFSLDKGKGISLAPTYSPKNIGEHQIIVSLYDKLRINLFDTKIISFNAVSHLGPFDIIIDPLTTRVRPSTFLPAKLVLGNMGAKATDVEVRISVECKDKTLSQSLITFLSANSKTEKLVNIQTCEQEGLYEVLASIMIFNKTWISSTSQFFVNSSFIQLQFDVPEKIKLQPGQSSTFPVEVTNIGNQKITDLKFVVQRIPLAWQKTSPSSIIEVEPNETVVFIVNITVPNDASPDSYEIRMTAAAEEVLERKISVLEVTHLAVLPPIQITTTPIFTYVLISLSSLAFILIAGISLKVYFKKRLTEIKKSDRTEILKKIRKSLSS